MFSPEKKALKELLTESQRKLDLAFKRITQLEKTNNQLQQQLQKSQNVSNEMDHNQTDQTQMELGETSQTGVNQPQVSQSVVTQQGEATSYANIVKKQRIPPIFVSKFKDINSIVAILTQGNNGPTFQALSNGEAKIICSTEDMYRFVRTTLRQVQKNSTHSLHELEFYTYQLKSEKPFQAVIRGLYPTTPIEEIKEDLANVGHELISAANIVVRRTVKKKTVKKPLPLFYINLKPKPNNQEVFEITHLLHSKVIVEAPRKKREIPQCKKCQAYGHTHAYCSRQDKCVKCAGTHPTSTCTKKKNEPCKCANCGGNHTANWKGCSIYQEKLTAESKRKMTVSQRIRQQPRHGARRAAVDQVPAQRLRPCDGLLPCAPLRIADDPVELPLLEPQRRCAERRVRHV